MIAVWTGQPDSGRLMDSLFRFYSDHPNHDQYYTKYIISQFVLFFKINNHIFYIVHARAKTACKLICAQ